MRKKTVLGFGRKKPGAVFVVKSVNGFLEYIDVICSGVLLFADFLRIFAHPYSAGGWINKY